MTKYIQKRDELLEHLKDQIIFLRLSASSYDKGFEDEAKRLATVIRVLVHDTSNSTSLLTLLNKKDIQFYDSAFPYHPQNLAPYNGLTMIIMSTSEGVFHVAVLEGGAPTRNKNWKVSFDIWWETMFVIKDRDDNTFTRKALILNAANKDGGAHVDQSLDKTYAGLSRFNSSGWTVFRNGVEDNFKNSLVLASIRQITHELMKTLKDGVADLFTLDDPIFNIFREYEEYCRSQSK